MDISVFLAVVVLAALLWSQLRAQHSSGPQDRVPPREVRPDPVPAKEVTPQPRAAASSASAWVPIGQSVQVAGIEILSGMIFVGTQLDALYTSGVEPALIDPDLPVQAQNPDFAGKTLQLPIAYRDLKPSARGAYLQWLAEGRNRPDISIGYVFLFFFGLERRLLSGSLDWKKSEAEVAQILAEVERLRDRYTQDPFFQNSAKSLLQMAQLRQSRGRFYETEVPPQERQGWEVPFLLRAGLGQLARDGKPIPPDWALSWLRCHPEVQLRTPASRCPDQFDQLFRIRYSQRYGAGMNVQSQGPLLRGVYTAANPSFAGAIDFPLGGLPDLMLLPVPLNQLREVAEECSTELDAYSRWLGRNPEGKDSLAALVLLPEMLATTKLNAAAARFSGWLNDQIRQQESVVLEARQLLEHWPSSKSDKLTKKDLTSLLQILEKLGFAVEPDIRFGGPALAASSPVILFRSLPGSLAEPSSAYTAETVFLHLAAVVVSAEGEVAPEEDRFLREHIQSAASLAPSERSRLFAHLRWLLQTKQDLRGVKKRVASVPEEQRIAIGHLLVSVAGANGQITPAEIATLNKLYPTLGLDPDGLYGHIHSLASQPADTDPVSVQPAVSRPAGFSIPKNSASGQTIALDMNKVQAKLRESAAVSTLLAGIFVEEEPLPLPARPAAAPQAQSIAGLDAAHSALLQALIPRLNWSRAEYEEICSSLGLMPDGALDRINEAAFEACGEPLAEGEDPLELNEYAIKELIP